MRQEPYRPAMIESPMGAFAVLVNAGNIHATQRRISR